MPDTNDVVDLATQLGSLTEKVDNIEEKVESISFGTLVGDFVKEHVVASIIGIFGTVASAAAILVGGVIAVEDRYAHAADLRGAETRLDNRISQSSLENRKWYIEDQIFTLELKQNKTPEDKARLEYFKNQRDTIDKKMEKIEQEIRSAPVDKAIKR